MKVLWAWLELALRYTYPISLETDGAVRNVEIAGEGCGSGVVWRYLWSKDMCVRFKRIEQVDL